MTNVYYSPTPGWRPSDPNAEVIYITPTGNTTGQVSGGVNVPAGINVTGTEQSGQNVGNDIAGQVKAIDNQVNNSTYSSGGQMFSGTPNASQIPSVNAGLAQQQINQQINLGNLQSYSGQLMTNQQYAKAELLNAVNPSLNPLPNQYGEYVKATNQEGKDFLNNYQKSLPFNQQPINQPYLQTYSNATKPEPTVLSKVISETVDFASNPLNLLDPIAQIQTGHQVLNTLRPNFYIDLYNNLPGVKLIEMIPGEKFLNQYTPEEIQANPILRGQQYLKQHGVPIPTTPQEDVEFIVGGLTGTGTELGSQFLSSKSGSLFTAGVLTSDIVAPVIKSVDQNIYPQTSIAGRFGKAVFEGALISEAPFLGGVYAKQFVTNLITNPSGTAESMIENYPETLGFLVGEEIDIDLKLPNSDLGDIKLSEAPQSMSYGNVRGETNINILEGLSPRLKISYNVPFTDIKLGGGRNEFGISASDMKVANEYNKLSAEQFQTKYGDIGLKDYNEIRNQVLKNNLEYGTSDLSTINKVFPEVSKVQADKFKELDKEDMSIKLDALRKGSKAQSTIDELEEKNPIKYNNIPEYQEVKSAEDIIANSPVYSLKDNMKFEEGLGISNEKLTNIQTSIQQGTINIGSLEISPSEIAMNRPNTILRIFSEPEESFLKERTDLTEFRIDNKKVITDTYREKNLFLGDKDIEQPINKILLDVRTFRESGKGSILIEGLKKGEENYEDLSDESVNKRLQGNVLTPEPTLFNTRGYAKEVGGYREILIYGEGNEALFIGAKTRGRATIEPYIQKVIVDMAKDTKGNIIENQQFKLALSNGNYVDVIKSIQTVKDEIAPMNPQSFLREDFDMLKNRAILPKELNVPENGWLSLGKGRIDVTYLIKLDEKSPRVDMNSLSNFKQLEFSKKGTYLKVSQFAELKDVAKYSKDDFQTPRNILKEIYGKDTDFKVVSQNKAPETLDIGNENNQNLVSVKELTKPTATPVLFDTSIRTSTSDYSYGKSLYYDTLTSNYQDSIMGFVKSIMGEGLLPSSNFNQPNSFIEPNIEMGLNPNIDINLNPLINPTINPTVNANINPLINPTINPLVEPTINPQINPLINPQINPLINPLINPTINPLINPNITPLITGGGSDYGLMSNSNKKHKKHLRQVSTYNVSVRKKGKYVSIGEDLTEPEAILLGERTTLNRISRTFKISKTGRTRDVFGIEQDITSNPQLFRNYQVRNKKEVPLINTFIQRNSANLKSYGEQSDLKLAKAMKKNKY